MSWAGWVVVGALPVSLFLLFVTTRYAVVLHRDWLAASGDGDLVDLDGEHLG